VTLLNDSTEQDPIENDGNAEDIPERELIQAQAIQMQRQDAYGGSVSISNRNDDSLWQAVMGLDEKISGVRERLDDLPNRVKTLEKLDVRIDPSFSPTFWALVILIVVIVAVVAFWAGQIL
jgi:hypothetical protein